MQIALFQQNINWLAPAENYAKIESQLSSHPEIDLLVMPEMCNTGFVTAPDPEDVEPIEVVEQRLLQLSARYQTALCGSFAVTVGHNDNRNRLLFVTPEGDVFHYDKHHLFTIGGEAHGYVAGQEHDIISWRGIRFLPIVCYDLRFPVWSRNKSAEAYDILLCVANWPKPRRLAWNTLLAARAIENQCYVVGVNRVGDDTVCHYDGGTRVVHPYGHLVAQCPDEEESLCLFTPDMQKLEDFRRKFPSLKDADSFSLD